MIPNKTHEALVILQEECAEVIQAISKIHRFGPDSVYDGVSNALNLEKELGDVLCLVNILTELSVIDRVVVEDYSVKKLVKLHKYSNLFSE